MSECNLHATANLFLSELSRQGEEVLVFVTACYLGERRKDSQTFIVAVIVYSLTSVVRRANSNQIERPQHI